MILTRKNALEMGALLTRYGNGEGSAIQLVEESGAVSLEVSEGTSISFGRNDPLSYRIKPRPVEGWVNVHSHGTTGRLYSTRARARADGDPTARQVFVREVEGHGD